MRTEQNRHRNEHAWRSPRWVAVAAAKQGSQKLFPLFASFAFHDFIPFVAVYITIVVDNEVKSECKWAMQRMRIRDSGDFAVALANYYYCCYKEMRLYAYLERKHRFRIFLDSQNFGSPGFLCGRPLFVIPFITQRMNITHIPFLFISAKGRHYLRYFSFAHMKRMNVIWVQYVKPNRTIEFVPRGFALIMILFGMWSLLCPYPFYWICSNQKEQTS